MKGQLAVCSRGILGVITSGGPVTVTYPDGTTGEAWTGVALHNGQPWSSRSPRLVESLDGEVES